MTSVTTLPSLVSQIITTLRVLPFYSERFGNVVLSTLESTDGESMDDHVVGFLTSRLKKLPRTHLDAFKTTLNKKLINTTRRCPMPAELFVLCAEAVVEMGWSLASSKSEKSPLAWATLRTQALLSVPGIQSDTESFSGFVDQLFFTTGMRTRAAVESEASFLDQLTTVLTDPAINLQTIPSASKVGTAGASSTAPVRRDFKSLAGQVLKK